MEFVYSSLMDGAKFIAHIPLACGKGCSFCCRMWVDATPPEVLYTVKKMPPEQRQQAHASGRTGLRQTSGASFFDRCGKVNPPCPLLDDEGACSVYELRPIACRTLVSTNVDDCRMTFMEGSDLGFPSPDVWFTLRDSYNTALEGALIHSGLAYQARELNDSLRIALTTPDAEARWLSGADDFAAAPMSPAPPLFEQPALADNLPAGLRRRCRRSDRPPKRRASVTSDLRPLRPRPPPTQRLFQSHRHKRRAPTDSRLRARHE